MLPTLMATPSRIVGAFGDETSRTAENPTHTCIGAGTYVVWLTVYDGKDSASDSLTITETRASPSRMLLM
jgi:PKD repeat protein